MEKLRFTEKEKEKIIEYFGKKIEELSLEEFDKKHRELRAKYHPDKFEKYSDDIIRELAIEKFKEIDQLAEKIKSILQSDEKPQSFAPEDSFGNNAVFAYNNLKIEIFTKEKDLKYYLFGTYYRWLERGDKYTIEGTKASIIIDENHAHHRIGFIEGIKMYLTFSETDSLEHIFQWLYDKIAGNALYLIIEGTKVSVDYNEMLFAVKKKTVRYLE